MCLRRVTVGRLDYSREQRRFAECEFGQLFAKPDLGGLFEAIDFCETAASQKNVITIERQDLLFAESPLERYSHQHLVDFPLPGSLPREEMILDNLLRESGA